MSMQKRMLTRTVALFDQLPQMHLDVPATEEQKSKKDEGYKTPEYDSDCSNLDEVEYWERMSFLASTSYYKTAKTRQLLLW